MALEKCNWEIKQMISPEAIYHDVMAHPEQYLDWFKVMGKEALKTTLFTYIPLATIVGLYWFIGG